jgi:HprK-related kinase B
VAERVLAELEAPLRATAAIESRLSLALDGVTVEVESNRSEIGAALAAYFAPFVQGDGSGQRARLRFTALEMPAPRLELAFQPWPREPGKAQDKEQYAELQDGRVVRKVRTGMHFLVASHAMLAVGPCLANVNQLINAINFALISARLADGWALCHSAAVARDGRALAISGISGAGKSTLTLWLLSEGYDYVSNDRVLVKREGARVRVCGVPKHPRVNPGTLLADPALGSVLPAERRAALERLSKTELWALEEKYDVDVASIYGPERIAAGGELAAFVVLTWRLDAGASCEPRQTSFASSPHLLDAVAKLPGPFYKPAAGTAVDPAAALGHERYLAQLAGVPVLELAGGVDFPRAVAVCSERLAAPQALRPEPRQ